MSEPNYPALPEIPVLPPKQARALNAVLMCPSWESAARQAGVTVKTLRSWLTQPAFAAALRDATTRALEMTVCRVAFLTDKALTALEQIIDDPKTPAHARARAASDIVSAAVRLRALQNEEIIGELEARLEERKAAKASNGAAQG